MLVSLNLSGKVKITSASVADARKSRNGLLAVLGALCFTCDIAVTATSKKDIVSNNCLNCLKKHTIPMAAFQLFKDLGPDTNLKY
jgi:hypothetical protein